MAEHYEVLGERRFVSVRPTIRIFSSVLLAGLCILCGCKHKVHEQRTPARPTPATSGSTVDTTSATGEFKNYTIVVPSQGPRIWAAEVKSGKADSKTGKLLLTGITCHMYKSGKEVLKATADSATAVVQGKNIRADLTGHILAEDTQRGQRVQSDTLHWVSTEDKIHADKFYWIGDGITVRADQGTFSTDLTEADFRGHVRMETTGTRARR